ncbi:MAG: Uma2 family endonuclease [Acidimicrobiales bacterium]
MVITVAAPTKPFTASDLDAMEDDGYRREVIEGRLIVTPSPISEHQDAVFRLGSLLDRHPPGFRVMIAPLDWRIPDGDSLQPDLMIIREKDHNPKGFQLATPLVVVEVLSPSTTIYDSTEKRARYESLGVSAYWIVNPTTPSITVMRLMDGRYVEIAQAQKAETCEVDWPYPVSVTPDDLIR